MIEVAVIAGPAGVGKTTVANEVSLQLRAAGVAHAVVDTDGLDDVFPVPDDQWRMTEQNLAHVWRTFASRGIHRLILTGVYLHRAPELAWIRRATTPDRLVLVELTAPAGVLRERVERREIGSGGQRQLARTAEQVARLAAERGPEVLVVDTGDRTVPEVAAAVIARLGWSPTGSARSPV